ncbi:hypothetical protein GCM10010317_027160 [Streptomyces mirabilis]|nr:hypothetical protein GCM10010317_027160 [Streptomyces mirabilis]
MRGGLPGSPRHRPAVLAAQVRQQPLDKIGEHLPRFRPGEQMSQPASQDSQSLGPVPDVLRTHIHQHDRTTISTNHQSHDLRLYYLAVPVVVHGTAEAGWARDC